MSGNSKSSSNSESKTSFSNVSQSNPFYNTTVDENGNINNTFKNGSAGQTAYNFVNQNISDLLNNYLNPSLDSTTNRAKLNEFNKTQQQNLQNNIINPLANNNMIRSSQATNMYNNLSNQAADYSNQLLANAQADTWNMINNLVGLYTQAYNGVNNEQNSAINAALGTGTTSTGSNSKAS